MPLQEEKIHHIQSPPLILDGLSCEGNGSQICGETEAAEKETFLPLFHVQRDLFWEDDELISLMSKKKETHHCFIDVNSDESLISARKEALEWIFKVKAHRGFNSLTTVLAVNYFDRFISSFKFQKDKPWMGQLTAAKVEETHVPLLLDLQAEESKFVFDSKTIQRMELMVLSTLQWRMNPMIPISFFDHITRRLGLRTHLHWAFLHGCEQLLLILIADSKFMLYVPSILDAATMLYVIKEIEPGHNLEYRKQLIRVLKTCEDEVNVCYERISELLEGHCKRKNGGKRKHGSKSSSPDSVIDASCSCGNSGDLWTATSSRQLLFKRSRSKDQQMRLLSINHMFVDVLSSPR